MGKVPIPARCEFHVALVSWIFMFYPGVPFTLHQKKIQNKICYKKILHLSEERYGKIHIFGRFQVPHVPPHPSPQSFPPFFGWWKFSATKQTSQRFQAAGCFHRLIAVDPSNDEWPAQLQVVWGWVGCVFVVFSWDKMGHIFLDLFSDVFYIVPW